MTATAQRVGSSAIRPFGLTKAVPVKVIEVPKDEPALTLCPDRQISVTRDGIPFIHEPSMGTSLTTKQQTVEDSQLDESTENDTD
ncbi:putative ATP-grasp-modified RiPP [Streptomyces albus]|uniref:putative ATP-grasp-modified RiPP n=1 Tax=Streptomyces albus TaxID=1888 RepID=UPI0024ACDCA5|nr:putative ATP-grasp-modified RiPP [Streptomyces albus]MDI6410782.1 putative ATP-grasp-modified RiPP [Streptomyces albus]